MGGSDRPAIDNRLVARRQKQRGMVWSLQSSDSLAALRTLVLNGGWDAYCAERRVLPLVVDVAEHGPGQQGLSALTVGCRHPLHTAQRLGALLKVCTRYAPCICAEQFSALTLHMSSATAIMAAEQRTARSEAT